MASLINISTQANALWGEDGELHLGWAEYTVLWSIGDAVTEIP